MKYITLSTLLDSLLKVISSKTTLQQALEDTLIQINGEKTQLIKILKYKPIFIDCWASWCKPCLNEMPYSRTLQKKFNGKLDFVFLSFDNNTSDWKRTTKSL